MIHKLGIMERFVKIALRLALLHTACNYLFFWIAFVCSMSAFSDGALAPIAALLMGFLVLLNFPIYYLRSRDIQDTKHFTSTAMNALTPWPSALQIIWAVMLGCIIAGLWILIIKIEPKHDA